MKIPPTLEQARTLLSAYQGRIEDMGPLLGELRPLYDQAMTLTSVAFYGPGKRVKPKDSAEEIVLPTRTELDAYGHLAESWLRLNEAHREVCRFLDAVEKVGALKRP